MLINLKNDVDQPIIDSELEFEEEYQALHQDEKARRIRFLDRIDTILNKIEVNERSKERQIEAFREDGFLPVLNALEHEPYDNGVSGWLFQDDRSRGLFSYFFNTLIVEEDYNHIISSLKSSDDLLFAFYYLETDQAQELLGQLTVIENLLQLVRLLVCLDSGLLDQEKVAALKDKFSEILNEDDNFVGALENLATDDQNLLLEIMGEHLIEMLSEAGRFAAALSHLNENQQGELLIILREEVLQSLVHEENIADVLRGLEPSLYVSLLTNLNIFHNDASLSVLMDIVNAEEEEALEPQLRDKNAMSEALLFLIEAQGLAQVLQDKASDLQSRLLSVIGKEIQDFIGGQVNDLSSVLASLDSSLYFDFLTQFDCFYDRNRLNQLLASIEALGVESEIGQHLIGTLTAIINQQESKMSAFSHLLGLADNSLHATLLEAFDLEWLDSAATLKEIFKFLDNNAHAVLLDKVGQVQLVKLIQSAENLAVVLSPLNPEIHRALLEQLQVQLPDFVLSGEQVAGILQALDAGQHEFLLQNLQELPNLIENADPFAAVLARLDDTQHGYFIDLLAKKLPELITDADDLSEILGALNQSIQQNVLAILSLANMRNLSQLFDSLMGTANTDAQFEQVLDFLCLEFSAEPEPEFNEDEEKLEDEVQHKEMWGDHEDDADDEADVHQIASTAVKPQLIDYLIKKTHDLQVPMNRKNLALVFEKTEPDVAQAKKLIMTARYDLVLEKNRDDLIRNLCQNADFNALQINELKDYWEKDVLESSVDHQIDDPLAVEQSRVQDVGLEILKALTDYARPARFSRFYHLTRHNQKHALDEVIPTISAMIKQGEPAPALLDYLSGEQRRIQAYNLKENGGYATVIHQAILKLNAIRGMLDFDDTPVSHYRPVSDMQLWQDYEGDWGDYKQRGQNWDELLGVQQEDATIFEVQEAAHISESSASVDFN